MYSLLYRHSVGLNQPGAVLVFLPGWNIIFSLMKHLQEHPQFGTAAYRILPLHSQVPREEQHKVRVAESSEVTRYL